MEQNKTLIMVLNLEITVILRVHAQMRSSGIALKPGTSASKQEKKKKRVHARLPNGQQTKTHLIVPNVTEEITRTLFYIYIYQIGY